MSYLSTPQPNEAPEASRPLLDAVKKQLGVVPNLFRVIANSPAALGAYLSFNGALAKTLDVKTRERIALAVAQVNGCDYCLSAHSYLATNLAKLDGEEVLLNRMGASKDAKAGAAVRFAQKVAEARGHVGAAEVASVRAAGFSDGEIVEIVALVAENAFTNFLNSVAGTAIDFPVVTAKAA